MSKPLPLHRVADILGYASENELTTLLRLVPGLPYFTKRGLVVADPEELANALADRGVVVPSDLMTVPDDRNNPAEDDDEAEEDDDEGEADAPRRRRR